MIDDAILVAPKTLGYQLASADILEKRVQPDPKKSGVDRCKENNRPVPDENSGAVIRGRPQRNSPTEISPRLQFPRAPQPGSPGLVQARTINISFDPSLYSCLLESEIFRDYQHAFEKSTGLPLSLHEPLDGQEDDLSRESGSGCAFCTLMARMNRVEGERFVFQKQLEQGARFGSKTLTRITGLCETAVPVWVGDRLVAFLHTGGILIETPSQGKLSGIIREILKSGSLINLNQVEDAYFKLRVIDPSQYEAMVRLISIFATHLAACGSLIVLQRAGAEQPAMVRACQILDRDFREELSLIEVARKVKVSAGYFCELFKKATGTNFVDYLATLRVNEAKNLLQNSNRRISDVAFEVGFQSLSQFNRTFRLLVRVSPRAYRASLGDRQNVHVENMRSISA